MKIQGRIFLLDDDELIISMLARSLKKSGYDTMIQTSAKDAFNHIVEWHPDLILLDIHLDDNTTGLDILAQLRNEKIDTPVIMLTADDSSQSAITAMKLGASDYLTKPFNVEEVKIVIANVLDKAKLREEVIVLRKKQRACVEQDMVGDSPVIKTILENAEKLATAKVQTVLITGESGTGKEVLARHIYNYRYLNKLDAPDYIPYISVNCTALPDNLVESELFGHTKHAFTDAKKEKKGLFELADGGVLLLDEIGDMRFDLQSKFLRVLEERKVRRLGGKTDVPIDLTVIATTNRDLRTAVENKEFREDLYFRLNTFSLEMPPLRERKMDIPALAQHFQHLFSRQYQKKDTQPFSQETLDSLMAYDWPGNIRELRNIIERCVVLGETVSMNPTNMTVELSGTPFIERRKSSRIILSEKGLSLEDIEKDLVSQALKLAKGNQTKAAKLLNISYDTLRYQVKKFELK